MCSVRPIQLAEMVLCLSQAVDLVSPLLADHHKRVAFVAVSLGREMKLPDETIRILAIAGSLHDVGGLSLTMRIDALQFEEYTTHEHAALGYLLLKTFPPFSRVAVIVRFHHVDWEYGAGCIFHDVRVPMESHIIHLADRIASQLKPDEAPLTQAERITDRIMGKAGKKFSPDLVSVFRQLADRECFWLEAMYSDQEKILSKAIGTEELEWDDNFLGLTSLFRRVIDFRSRFTSTHTSGVAACAVALAELAGFSPFDCNRMAVAGFIHDLGKLAVPAEILDKQASLSKEEFDIVRTHTYHTDHVLMPIQAFDTIRKWGALHHERLDGNGYPYHLTAKDLSQGSRIISVADAFVALTENRPYRKGLGRKQVLELLEKMVRSSALDGIIVDLLVDNFDGINDRRIRAQKEAAREYRDFVREAKSLQECRYCGGN